MGPPKRTSELHGDIAPSAKGPVTSGDQRWDTIAWLDHRAIAAADECTRSGHVVLDSIGGVMSPEMQTPKLMWLKRKLPLICANPDRVVEHAGRIIYCGGALADLYEAHGGRILMAGKPYRPIYDEALRLAQAATGRALDRRRILAIGDSVRTDAIGAANAGLDLLFITGSIHAAELDAFGSPDPQAVADLVAPSGARLVGAMPRLAW